MANCMPRLDDRDFQTLAALFPDMKADGFHVVPKTPGACVTVDDMYHEDVWFSKNWRKFDTQRHVTVNGRDNQPVELENGGWEKERTSIFDDHLSKIMEGYPRKDLFGAFHGMVKIAQEILISNDPRKGAVEKFLSQLKTNIRSQKDVMAIFKGFDKFDWDRDIQPAMGAIHNWAMGRGDYGTAEFTKVIRAAINIEVYKNADWAKSWLTETNALDNKQREFLKLVEEAIETQRSEPPPPKPKPKKTRKATPTGPRPPAPPRPAPKPPAEKDEWGAPSLY